MSTFKLLSSALALASIFTGQEVSAQTCTASPTTITNFDASAFAGNWHMHASTFYANDEFGCIKFTISEPNSNGKLDYAL